MVRPAAGSAMCKGNPSRSSRTGQPGRPWDLPLAARPTPSAGLSTHLEKKHVLYHQMPFRRRRLGKRVPGVAIQTPRDTADAEEEWEDWESERLSCGMRAGRSRTA